MLQSIHKQLGQQGLDDFLAHVTHPRSGILPQTTEAKPLPDTLKNVFETAVNEINAQLETAYRKKRGDDQDPLELFDKRSRRNFLKIVSGAALVGGFSGYKSAPPESDTQERILNIVSSAMSMGLIAGGAIFVGRAFFDTVDSVTKKEDEAHKHDRKPPPIARIMTRVPLEAPLKKLERSEWYLTTDEAIVMASMALESALSNTRGVQR